MPMSPSSGLNLSRSSCRSSEMANYVKRYFKPKNPPKLEWGLRPQVPARLDCALMFFFWRAEDLSYKCKPCGA